MESSGKGKGKIMKKWLISLGIGSLMTGFLVAAIWAVLVMPKVMLTIVIVGLTLGYFTKLAYDFLGEDE